jgi:hypothetical protein
VSNLGGRFDNLTAKSLIANNREENMVAAAGLEPALRFPRSLLTDYAEVAQIAATFGKSERTITRWMDMPDGLPFAKIGNKRLVHIPTAKDWVFGRMRRPSRRRR